MKDFQMKMSKLHSGASGDGDKGEPQEAGEGDGISDNQFEKLCSNDKVIQSIQTLIKDNEADVKQKKRENKGFEKEHKSFSSECDQLKKQIDELEVLRAQFEKEIEDEIQAKAATAGGGADGKAQLKEFRKQKNKERKEIEEANMARKSTLQE